MVAQVLKDHPRTRFFERDPLPSCMSPYFLNRSSKQISNTLGQLGCQVVLVQHTSDHHNPSNDDSRRRESYGGAIAVVVPASIDVIAEDNPTISFIQVEEANDDTNCVYGCALRNGLFLINADRDKRADEICLAICIRTLLFLSL